MQNIVIVTGATGGIGQAIVSQFMAQGDYVYAMDLHEEAVQQLASSYQHHHIKGLAVDVTSEEAIHTAIAQIIQEQQRIDVVVNNAGLQYRAKVEDFPLAQWQQLIDVMLTGPFLMTKHVFPHMKRAKYGRVINISSVHGLMATPEKAAYVAAKHGVIGLTDVTGIEGAPYGITVNAVCPGVVRTPLIEKQLQDVTESEGISEQEALNRIVYPKRAMARFITVEEIANMVVYLASPQASAITMEHIKVAGGM